MPDGFTITQNRASAANPMLTTQVGSSHIELLTEHICKAKTRLYGLRVMFAV